MVVFIRRPEVKELWGNHCGLDCDCCQLRCTALRRGFIAVSWRQKAVKVERRCCLARRPHV